MPWTPLQYTRNQVNAAGRALINQPVWEREMDEAIKIVDNFRAAHSFPLNTIRHRLRIAAKLIDKNAIIAQRLKRLSSIVFKLDRFRTMRLSEMQDIGGCRAIVESVNQVEELANTIKSSRIIVLKLDYQRKRRPKKYKNTASD